MRFLLFFVIYLLNLRESINARSKKPSYFPTCFRNDPQLNQCLLRATEQMRPYLVQGIPELNLPPFEPFNLPQLGLQQGTQALNFKAVLKNVIIHGLTKYKFSRFDFDVANLQFFCNATLSNMLLEGDYTVNGRVLIAPVVGSGTFTAAIDHADVFVYQKYKKSVFKDKKIHLVPINTTSTINVQNPKANLKGLFDNEGTLNAAVNKAINDNVDQLFQDIKPVVEETISTIMADLLLKSIIHNIAFDELYPIK
ncbi:hypothetical protein ABEB36_013253 [Hypothenemus hampei]|uniref:Uncharacterized protein n=1 Tax=Hypothenemus hampei TaxID=57062 RepID=A0ABD1E7D7_HYPHA